MQDDMLPVAKPIPDLTNFPVIADPTAYIEASLAPATRERYSRCLQAFQLFCRTYEVAYMPAAAETVAAFLANQSRTGWSVSSIAMACSAIRWLHEAADESDPTQSKGVKATLAGIRRVRGSAPKRKAPITAERLALMVGKIDTDTLTGTRDKAMLLVGFASAMRASELLGLTMDDIQFTEQGVLLALRKSKTDQEGHGHVRAVLFSECEDLCPVRSLKAWIKSSKIREGFIFRSFMGLYGELTERPLNRCYWARLIKSRAKAAGLAHAQYSTHSLRAGFITSASERGARPDRIMDHTGHKSAHHLRVYTRHVDAFKDHAGEGML